ncbi:MAG: indolepyruvate oxidoreductase subunit beta [Bacteroidales bacterium]|jgi:indolepyruvate ferredoxin oxidoreductase beta subunit|nr:indolepyruvate oxidoreductase subunit beta [Bacteroidales bacterium]MBR4460923.1 indolepyruvate oxidoreductase subunit beta [Paludibacteraceae bacterium]MBR4547691.1 indolepyruvate oxidoreductase subunit beta [Paludibacteraceae bacterium]
MKQDIILSGVGGQGILSIATVIGKAALDKGLYIKQAEVHGMSQRGGDVQSNLRLSSTPIYSDLVPMGGCDLIISLEPMEALRYLPYLKKDGWIVTSTAPFLNITNYPEMEKIQAELARLPHVISLDADEMAKEVRSPRSANMVLLGAASSVLQGLSKEALEHGIQAVFARKGEAIVETNLAAFRAGYDHAIALPNA